MTTNEDLRDIGESIFNAIQGLYEYCTYRSGRFHSGSQIYKNPGDHTPEQTKNIVDDLDSRIRSIYFIKLAGLKYLYDATQTTSGAERDVCVKDFVTALNALHDTTIRFKFSTRGVGYFEICHEKVLPLLGVEPPKINRQLNSSIRNSIGKDDPVEKTGLAPSAEYLDYPTSDQAIFPGKDKQEMVTFAEAKEALRCQDPRSFANLLTDMMRVMEKTYSDASWVANIGKASSRNPQAEAKAIVGHHVKIPAQKTGTALVSVAVVRLIYDSQQQLLKNESNASISHARLADLREMAKGEQKTETQRA